MDFKEQTTAMLMHLGNDYTDERHRELISALCMALAKTFALISDHDKMHDLVQRMCEAIELQACEEHQSLHEDQDIEENTITVNSQTMTYEAFLRDVFHPDHKND